MVTVTLDMITGAMRMDVPGKFEGTKTKILDPALVAPPPPPFSECGTSKTVEASFRPWLSGESP